MDTDDMRGVVFTADTEVTLLDCLRSLPGYTLSNVREASGHRLLLTSSEGAEIHLIHTPGSTYAATSSILPQDQEQDARPFGQDEATKLSQVVEGMDSIRATLDYSVNDRAKLMK